MFYFSERQITTKGKLKIKRAIVNRLKLIFQLGLIPNAHANSGSNSDDTFLLFYFAMFPALWFLAYRNKSVGYGPNLGYFVVSAIVAMLLWFAFTYIWLELGISHSHSWWLSSFITLSFYWFMVKWPMTEKKIMSANNLASMSGVVLFIVLMIIIVLFGDVSDEPYPK